MCFYGNKLAKGFNNSLLLQTMLQTGKHPCMVRTKKPKEWALYCNSSDVNKCQLKSFLKVVLFVYSASTILTCNLLNIKTISKRHSRQAEYCQFASLWLEVVSFSCWMSRFGKTAVAMSVTAQASQSSTTSCLLWLSVSWSLILETHNIIFYV